MPDSPPMSGSRKALDDAIRDLADHVLLEPEAAPAA